MLSHACEGGEGGIDEQGQASPSDTSSIRVREGGQMFERPVMRTVQRVGTVMTGTEAACVVGWERR